MINHVALVGNFVCRSIGPIIIDIIIDEKSSLYTGAYPSISIQRGWPQRIFSPNNPRLKTRLKIIIMISLSLVSSSLHASLPLLSAGSA